MQLLILRHARAAERESFPGPDAERPLTKAGAERCLAVLRRLQPALKLDAVWTSPWLRARQTAELVAQVWQVPLRDRPWLAGDGRPVPERVNALAAEAPADAALALVGHEPVLGELIGELTGSAALPLRKSGMAILSGEPGSGRMRLEALLRPRLILAIGK